MTPEEPILVPLPTVRSAYFIARERGMQVDDEHIVNRVRQHAHRYGDVMFVDLQDVITELASEAIEDGGDYVAANVPIVTALQVATLLGAVEARQAVPALDGLALRWSGEAARSLTPPEAAIFMSLSRTLPPLTSEQARAKMRESPLARLSSVHDEGTAHIRMSVYQQAVQALISGAMSVEEQPLSNQMQAVAAVLEQTVDVTR